MNFLEEVRSKRQKLADVLSDPDYSGIRDIVEELYPDKAHFIYELLQNAEDTGATKVRFELTEKMLIFEHDGRQFDEDDVWGITNIGNGTKKDQEDKIGRFGVGFKAVFAYSETPHIWSSAYSFKIEELVLPSEIPPLHVSNNKTRFEFPFNNPKKPADTAYEEIKGGLEGLAETTLLFLTALSVIQWKIGKEGSGEIRRVQHSLTNHIEVSKRTSKKMIVSSHFLRFTAPVEGLPKQCVSIAFALDFLPNVNGYDEKVPLSKQLRIVPASHGRVAVFFPAEKETSSLRFHIHAPFVPELSRASIKETPANEPLFNQLGELCASSLHSVREFKLLNVDFLGVLPNPQDNIPDRYQIIRKEIIEEMNAKPLTPTYTKSHMPARNLLQAKASLKELLSVKDLEILVDYEGNPPRWAVGASQKNSNQDRFLSGLDIREWDFSQFLEMLQNKTSLQANAFEPPRNISPKEVMDWLGSKPSEWHQQMYSLIYNEIHGKAEYLRTRLINSLKPLKIVRLINGGYCPGNQCYFPNDSIDRDELIPLVDANVYSSGKSWAQQEDARMLLNVIGVRDIGEEEQVKSILQKRYAKPPESLDDQEYIKDLKRFFSLVEKDNATARIFSEFYIYKNKNNQWAKPGQVFLDAPIIDTDLTAYYEALGDDATKNPLSDWYYGHFNLLEKMQKFSKMTGVEDGLNIIEVTCRANAKRDYLYGASGDKESVYKIDRDYYLPLLHKVIESKNIKVSRVIWRAMCRYSTGKLVAQYRKSRSGEIRSAPSLVLNWLEDSAWIPQGNGEFVLPLNASKELLPEGFPFDKGDEWLKAIRFGEEEQQRSEEYKRRRETAKEFGFSDEDALSDAQWFAGLDVQQRQRFKEEVERKRSFNLPDSSSSNPEHRADRVGQQAGDAPGRETENRQRSVSVNRAEVKQEAGQYLIQQYTNVDEEMICQICKAPLPFKLDDGSYYFEKVEFLPNLEKRHYQNYLALCPNHSAMFKHTNGSQDILSEMFKDLACNELEVILAQQDMNIYFTANHRNDLLAVLQTVESLAEAQDDLEDE